MLGRSANPCDGWLSFGLIHFSGTFFIEINFQILEFYPEKRRSLDQTLN